MSDGPRSVYVHVSGEAHVAETRTIYQTDGVTINIDLDYTQTLLGVEIIGGGMVTVDGITIE